MGVILMYLGIDLGTTGLKCVMFEDDGAVAAEYNEEYPLIFVGSFVEQDAEVWWSNVVTAVRSLVEKTGRRDVKALSVSSQSISFVPVDDDGRPLYNSINWLDMRATAECERIMRDLGEETVFLKTGKHVDPAYSLPKLMWFRENRREVYDRASKILFPLDFLNMRFTGKYVTDYTIAGGSMLYNIVEKRWDEELLAYSGIDIEKLPEVAEMGADLGKILPYVADELGISPDCRVILGGQDQKIAAVGAGISDGVVTMSFGTASAIEKLSREMNADSPLSQFRFNDGYFVTEGVADTTGAALKWLSRTMGGVSYRECDELAATSVPGANGVTASTSFSKGASFEGITLSTTRGDLIYALYEGTCREIADRIEKMGGATEIRVFGGGSKSEIWCRVLSRITGCRIGILDTPETASRGAAIIASHGKIAPAEVVRFIEEK